MAETLISKKVCGTEHLILVRRFPDYCEIHIFDIEKSLSWRGDFNRAYIEEMTSKTGHFRSFEVFINMLMSALLGEKPSVIMNILTFSSLRQLLKAKVGVKPATSIECNKRRYLIVTHSSNYEKIHYPLTLSLTDSVDPQLMQASLNHLQKKISSINIDQKKTKKSRIPNKNLLSNEYLPLSGCPRSLGSDTPAFGNGLLLDKVLKGQDIEGGDSLQTINTKPKSKKAERELKRLEDENVLLKKELFRRDKIEKTMRNDIDRLRERIRLLKRDCKEKDLKFDQNDCARNRSLSRHEFGPAYRSHSITNIPKRWPHSISNFFRSRSLSNHGSSLRRCRSEQVGQSPDRWSDDRGRFDSVLNRNGKNNGSYTSKRSRHRLSKDRSYRDYSCDSVDSTTMCRQRNSSCRRRRKQDDSDDKSPSLTHHDAVIVNSPKRQSFNRERSRRDQYGRSSSCEVCHRTSSARRLAPPLPVPRTMGLRSDIPPSRGRSRRTVVKSSKRMPVARRIAANRAATTSSNYFVPIGGSDQPSRRGSVDENRIQISVGDIESRLNNLQRLLEEKLT